ncbi:MAG: hypothetical protein KJ732_04655, partial [Candidatus Margulisbacteria bacterium]|nr:hypothetical protein [Candidatus Margulisiibacteriota bacterium]
MKKYIVGSVLILGLTVITLAIAAFKPQYRLVQAPAPSFIKAWGTQGAGNGQFNTPSGVAIDSSGDVYVIDAGTGNGRIQKFNSDGVYQAQWQCGEPEGIAIDNKNRIIVVLPGMMNVYDTSGSGALYASMALKVGLSENMFLSKKEFASSACVAAGPGLDIFVTTNHFVLKCNSFNSIISTWGGEWNRGGHPAGPSGKGLFDNIEGIAVDLNGTVYVVDAGNYRVQKFNSNGKHLGQWGSKGDGPTEFGHPKGIAVDESGYVYVTDMVYNRITKFDSDGKFITRWGKEGTGNGEFKGPASIAVRDGVIYVADMYNHRIQKFQFLVVSTPPKEVKKIPVKSPEPQPPAPTSTTTLSPVIEPKAPDEQLTPTTSTVLTTTTTRQIRRF